MPNQSNVNDLFIAELQDLYDAEQQITKALPKMAEHASSPKLAQAFQTHLKETQQQVQRLEQIFKILNLSAKTKTCQAMRGLVEEAKSLVNEYGGTPLIDAALIAAAQKVEHYEIASYGCIATWAKVLKLDQKVFDLLQATMQEEKHADQLLTQLAETEINAETFKAAAHQAMR